MAAFHKQQQADQRTKLKSRPPDATSGVATDAFEQYSPLRWHEQHGDGSQIVLDLDQWPLIRTGTGGMVSSQSLEVVIVDAQRSICMSAEKTAAVARKTDASDLSLAWQRKTTHGKQVPWCATSSDGQGFLANNVVLRNDASKLDLSAGSLVPRGERPPVLKRQIIGRKPSRVQQGDLDFAVT
ncbi:hypothetical protein E4U16_001511 [Claviceps sp. LM84 group G4]|nr:hypothetical protein E4U16_001511 [Claviceps sp. LM84 group G4]